jgi:hypothetical protein
MQQALDASRLNEEWSAEAHFVLGLACEIRKEETACKDHNRLAVTKLELIGAKKKSLKALHNYLAAETRINPERMLLADYHSLYRRARKLDRVVAGLALNSIARQYQYAGAPLAALKYANRAIHFLQRDTGTFHYYMTLLNRAHILIDLGRLPEARVDADQTRVAGFKEVVEGLKLVELRLAEKTGLIESEYAQVLKNSMQLNEMEVSSRERFMAHQTGSELEPLTALESKLIQLLSDGRKTKFDLIDRLYESSIDFESREARFKNVLARLKKKRPGLIVLDEGYYRISEPTCLIA